MPGFLQDTSKRGRMAKVFTLFPIGGSVAHKDFVHILAAILALKSNTTVVKLMQDYVLESYQYYKN